MANDLLDNTGEYDISDTEPEWNLDGTEDAPRLTLGRLAGAFAYRVRETPGLITSAINSFRKYQESQNVDPDGMLVPLDPFDADYNRIRGLPSGRTAMDDAFDRLPHEAKIRASAKMEELSSDGSRSPNEAWKQAVWEEIQGEQKRISKNLQAVTEATKRPEAYKQSSGFFEDVASGIGSSVASLGAYAIGGPYLGGLMTYATLHGSKAQELEELGVEAEDVLKGSIVSAALQTPLEQLSNWIQISRIMKANGTWTGWISKVAEGAGGEGATEIAQQYPDVFATILALNPDVSLIDVGAHIKANAGDITADALYAGAVGAVSGGVTTGAGAAAVGGIEKLVTNKQKLINEERKAKVELILGKDEMTPADEDTLRASLNLAEDADVKKIINQVKKQYEIEKPIDHENRTESIKLHEERYGPEVAESTTALMDAMARSYAERYERKPTEFYDKVQIKGEGTPEVVVPTDEAGTEGDLFQFGGVLARNANLNMREVAEQALAAGKAPEDVWKATGWRMADDGKWRFEIDDSKLKFKDFYDKVNSSEEFKLSDVIEHKELLSQYPELENVNVKFTDSIGTGTKGAFKGDTIELNRGVFVGSGMSGKEIQESIKDTLIHEIQHWIQQKEGFARGGSPEQFVQVKARAKALDNMLIEREKEILGGKTLSDIDREAFRLGGSEREIRDRIKSFEDTVLSDSEYSAMKKEFETLSQQGAFQSTNEQYRRLHGEYESRDASARRTWDADMRREVMPGADYKDAIIRMSEAAPRELNLFQVDAWHGSPHKFEKIGTGEGGQVELLQDHKEPAEPLGKINITVDSDKIKALITHFQGANPSTTIHELGHFVTGMLWEQGDTDYLTLAEYAGVSPDNALIGLSGWTKDQHETVARAFEIYLMEGRSPSQKLQQVFQRMKQWLLEIYRTIKALDVELTDDVRRVFDRLLTTELERAENPLSEVREWLNVDEIQNREIGRRAITTAEAVSMEYDDLLARARELAASKRAKNKAAAEKKIRAGMMKEAKASIEGDPFYQMLDELLKNGGMKQSTVEGMYDSAWIQQIQLQRPGLISKNGIAPDVIGMQYGYDNPDAMIQDILYKPGKQEAIDTYFDGLWSEYERYEHLSWAETLEDSIQNEIDIFNDLLKKEGEKPKPAKGLKKKIREITGIIRPEEMKQLKEDLKRDAKVAREAWNAARKAMRDEMDVTLPEEKRKAATKEKEKSIRKIEKLRLAHMDKIQKLVNEFKEKTRIDKYVREINKLVRRKSLAPEFRSQIAAFVSDFMDVPQSFKGDSPEVDLITFIESKREQNEYLTDAILAELTHKPQQRRNAKGYRLPLKADDWERIYRTVKMMAYMNKIDQAIISGTEKIERDRMIGQMVGKLYDTWGYPTGPDTPLDVLEKRKRLAWYQKLTQGAKDYLADIRLPEFIFDAMDGWQPNGPNAEVYRWLKRASDAELKLGAEYTKAVRKIFKDRIGKKSAQWAQKLHEIPGITITDPATGKTSRMLTKEQMIMIALNSGNDGNLAALREGYKLTDDQIQSVWDALTTEEQALVNDIWALLDSLYPKLNEVHKQLTGVKLKKVEGKYFPLAWERELSWKAAGFAQKQAEKDMFSSAYTRPNVEAGFRKERTGGKMAPELSFGVITRHLVNTVHDITNQIPVRNAQKIIADPVYREAVSESMGREIYSQLMPWLANIAKPKRDPISKVERLAGRLRANATVVGLGLKFSVALQQPLAYTQTIDEVGLIPAMKALGQFYRAPKKGKEFVDQASAMMANRKETFDRELMQLRSEFDNGIFKKSQAATNAFFALIDITDAAFRYPTWLAGYNAEIARSGDHDKAVDYADKVVTKTQGVGLAKNLSMMQRGGPQRSELMKLATMFYSFFSPFANRFMDTTTRYRLGNISLSQAAKSYFWILIIPALFGTILQKRRLPEGTEWLKAIPGYILAGLPVIRDIFNPILSGYKYAFSPVQKALELPGNIVKIATSEGPDKTRKVVSEVLELSGYALGLPTGQMTITMDGIIDLMEGKTDNPAAILFRQERPKPKHKRKAKAAM